MLQRRIVDAVMIILRPVEHDHGALEGVRVFRIVEIALLEFRADHARLHDRGIEQVALEVQEARLLLQRIVVGADHLVIPGELAPAVLADGRARAGQRALVDLAGTDQFRKHGRQAAGAIIFLAEIFAGRLHVHEQRDLEADALPVVAVERRRRYAWRSH